MYRLYSIYNNLIKYNCIFSLDNSGSEEGGRLSCSHMDYYWEYTRRTFATLPPYFSSMEGNHFCMTKKIIVKLNNWLQLIEFFFHNLSGETLACGVCHGKSQLFLFPQLGFFQRQKPREEAENEVNGKVAEER